VATAEQIGVRDGRRIRGRYTVLKDDLAAGIVHDDAIVRVRFGIDVHALSAEHNKNHAIMPKKIDMKPYDIPLRALIAQDVDGLMMAGRCISGDFIAHSSYRVTGNSVAMGEAAGVTAARAAFRLGIRLGVRLGLGAAALVAFGFRRGRGGLALEVGGVPAATLQLEARLG
jgi:hypothetical protein